MSGGYNLHGIQAGSFGFKRDLDRSIIGLVGHTASEASMLLHNSWDSYFQSASKSATMLVIAHSRGAIDLRNALEIYSPPKRSRIFVLAIAPAAYINESLCGGVAHYYSSRDFVPLFDVTGRKKNRHTSYSLTPAPQASKIWDHSFQSPTYKKNLGQTIERYLENGDF